MPTYNETGSGGLTTQGLVKMTFVDRVTPCSGQTATTLCCTINGVKRAKTWLFIQNAWVAAITVCDLHL